MKYIIMFVLFILSFSINAQNVTITSKATVQTEQSLTETAKRTAFLYSNLPVYQSSKSNYFIIKKSKKQVIIIKFM